MRNDTIPSFRNSFCALSLTLEKVLLERGYGRVLFDGSTPPLLRRIKRLNKERDSKSCAMSIESRRVQAPRSVEEQCRVLLGSSLEKPNIPSI